MLMMWLASCAIMKSLECAKEQRLSNFNVLMQRVDIALLHGLEYGPELGGLASWMSNT